jgi:hypothetical protein
LAMLLASNPWKILALEWIMYAKFSILAYYFWYFLCVLQLLLTIHYAKVSAASLNTSLGLILRYFCLK